MFINYYQIKTDEKLLCWEFLCFKKKEIPLEVAEDTFLRFNMVVFTEPNISVSELLHCLHPLFAKSKLKSERIQTRLEEVALKIKMILKIRCSSFLSSSSMSGYVK